MNYTETNRHVREFILASSMSSLSLRFIASAERSTQAVEADLGQKDPTIGYDRNDGPLRE